MTSQVSGNTNPSTSDDKNEKIIFKARAFQLTLNSSENLMNCYDGIMNELKKLKSCDYIISCKEKAPTTGHEHIHIYAHFCNMYKLSKKILQYKPHVETCKGSPKQNIEYIRKDGEILDEIGDEPKQGTRHTVKELKEIKNPDELESHEFNTWQKIQNMPKKIKLDEWKKDITVYYIQGPSGCGKTEKAKEILRENNIDELEEIKFESTFYHGVVDGTGAAVYDDFRDSHMKASEFINLIDYNTHNMNVKGGSVRNKYNLLIITSIQPIDEIYRNMNDEPRKQWMRRVKVIDLFPNDYA